MPHHLLDVVDPDEDVLGRRVRAAGARGARATSAAAGAAAHRGRRHRPLPARAAQRPVRGPVARRGRCAAGSRRSPSGAATRACTGCWRRVDPEAAARIEARDRVRVVRALEVFRATGRPLSSTTAGARRRSTGFDVRVLGLAPAARRAARGGGARAPTTCSRAGLLDEVRGAARRGYPPDLRPLQAIGYRQAVGGGARRGGGRRRRGVISSRRPCGTRSAR